MESAPRFQSVKVESRGASGVISIGVVTRERITYFLGKKQGGGKNRWEKEKMYLPIFFLESPKIKSEYLYQDLVQNF